MFSAGSARRRCEQVVDVARVVLPVAVDLHGDLVAVLARVEIAALHGPADAEVERQAQHGGAGRASARAAVASVEPSSTTRTSKPGAQRRISAIVCGDRLSLVVGGDDCEVATHCGIAPAASMLIPSA